MLNIISLKEYLKNVNKTYYLYDENNNKRCKEINNINNEKYENIDKIDNKRHEEKTKLIKRNKNTNKDNKKKRIFNNSEINVNFNGD